MNKELAEKVYLFILERMNGWTYYGIRSKGETQWMN